MANYIGTVNISKLNYIGKRSYAGNASFCDSEYVF